MEDNYQRYQAMTEYTIHWLHIPTKKQGTNTHRFENINQLYDALNDWNRSNPGTWQYWFFPGMSGNGSDTKEIYKTQFPNTEFFDDVE